MFDSRRQRVTLAGRGNANGCAQNLCDWDGQNWREIVIPSSQGVVAYDSTRERFDFYSSLGILWTYAPDQSAHVEEFGAGCHGATPAFSSIRMVAHPWVGEPVEVQPRGLPPNSPGIFMIGALGTLSGRESISIPLCVSPSLVGQQFFTQVIAVDTGANGALVTMSGGLAWTVGER